MLSRRLIQPSLNKIRYLLSYCIPLTIEQCRGDLSPLLQVNLYEGKYRLDGRLVNYSFGGLHLAFEKAFEFAHLENKTIHHALILGLGAGSVVNLLVNKYQKKCNIIGVEADPIVIELAQRYFGLQQYSQLKVVVQDAHCFVQEHTGSYDLIVMDVFIENKVPPPFLEETFLLHLNRLLSPRGLLFYNYIPENAHDTLLASRMKKIWNPLTELKIKIGHTDNIMFIHDKLNRLPKSAHRA